MPTRVIIELEVEGDPSDIETAVEFVLDWGHLQDALAAYGKNNCDKAIEVTSSASRMPDGLPIRAIPGHVISTAIAAAWHGGAWGRHPEHLATREKKTIELAESMVGGLSRDDILAIARKEARLAGDTRSGITLERTQ